MATGWDTEIRFRGRSTNRLEKYYRIYWLDKLKVIRSECEKRFDDRNEEETENWKLMGVKAVAIEYKPNLFQHRFDMGYFFNKRYWWEITGHAQRMPWAMKCKSGGLIQ